MKSKFLSVFLILTILLVLTFNISNVKATTIFSDGFESGDFSAWTGTTAVAGNTVEVVASNAHHGIYSSHLATANSGFDAPFACSYIAFAGQSAQVNSRFYVKFNTIQDVGGNGWNLAGQSYDTSYGESVSRIFVQPSGGNYYLQVQARNDTALVTGNLGTTIIQTGVWYCIELETKLGDSGSATIYLNGVSESTISGVDNNNMGAGTIIRFYMGYGFVYNGAINDANFDCAIVADAYIGPEVSGQDLTFQLSQTIHATSSLTENQEKGFSLSEIVALTSSIVKQKELGFPLSETVHATDSLTMSKEIFVVIHEWVYSLQETPHIIANLYTSLEVVEKVSLGIGFYIGVLALVIALMAYLRSRH